MMKLTSLREAFLAAPAEMRITPQNLLTFAEKGSLTAWRGGANRAYKLDYTANVIVTGYCREAQDIFFLALDWLARECPDADETALQFHVDIVDRKCADVSIAFPLTEIVAGKIEADGLHPTPTAEPDADAIDMKTFFPNLPAAPKA